MARWKKYTKLILNTFGVISYSELYTRPINHHTGHDMTPIPLTQIPLFIPIRPPIPLPSIRVVSLLPGRCRPRVLCLLENSWASPPRINANNNK